MDKQKRSFFRSKICVFCQNSMFLTMIKYPSWYLSIAGVYVPYFCARSVLKSIDTPHSKIHHDIRGIRLVEMAPTGPTGKNVPDIKSVGMTEVSIHNDGVYPKRVNKATKAYFIIRKLSRKIRPEEKKSFKSKIIRKRMEEPPSACCKRQWISFLKIAFCCIHLTLILLELARQLYLLPDTFSDDNALVYSLAYLTFRLFLLFLTVTSNYANFNHFRLTFCAWLEYEMKYGLKLDIKIHTKRVRNSFMVFIFFNISAFLTVFVGILMTFGGFSFELWPFDAATALSRFTAAILFACISFFGSCNIFSVHAFRSTIMYLLISEFKYLHDRMVKILSETSNNCKREDEFGQLVEQLRALTELTQKSFQMVKHTIAAAYMFAPILMCLVLYDLAGGAMNWNQNLLTIYTVFIVLGMISSTTQDCAELRSRGKFVWYTPCFVNLVGSGTDYARSVWSAVYKVPWCNHSQAMLEKLSVFMNQLTVDDISYSVYGMFTVDYSSLMMTGGTVLTYGIFVLQLKLEHKQ